ncbi:MAG: GTPase [Candidatus Nitrosocaldaceae archaeon]|nr:MAG: GTPase [Candidatus Nitrosocaldaceae archaeon]GIU72881.1 MAG: GTPase [Candidatus Nitrosocaldaceae archaeon]
MRKVIILGAAGRDFHNFNVYFRDNKEYKVIAFTAAQIPFIADRVYPKELAGKFYPNGIPIYDEDKLEELINDYNVDEVVFAYSDVSYNHLMHLASRAIAARASFRLLGLKDTQLVASKPVISVTATRTGAGKSSISRVIANIAKEYKDIAVIRHPMPYLTFDPIQIFTSIEDLDKYQLTLEEEEEYINHIRDGNTVYAGVDYKVILDEVEKKHDLIIWDGGNNDFPFIKPDLNITVVDPLRAEDSINYYPSEINLRMADIIIINKVNTASNKDVDKSIKIAKSLNKDAKIFKVGSYPIIDESIKGKRVIIIDDAPTITHGEVKESIASKLARDLGCEIIDPRPYAKGSIKEVYEKYNISNVLPTSGYSYKQLQDLEDTINSIEADLIIAATPADLSRRMKIDKPIVKVEFRIEGYDYEQFVDYIRRWLKKL